MCQTTSPTPVHSFFPLISPPPRPASRRAGLFMNGCGLPSFLPSFILGGLNESLATHHRPLLSMSLLGEERVVLLLPRKWLSHTWQKEGKGGKHSWEGGGEWAPLVENNLLTAERRLLSVWFINFCKRTLYTVMWNSSLWRENISPKLFVQSEKLSGKTHMKCTQQSYCMCTVQWMLAMIWHNYLQYCSNISLNFAGIYPALWACTWDCGTRRGWRRPRIRRWRSSARGGPHWRRSSARPASTVT